jgi:hypothetical protein
MKFFHKSLYLKNYNLVPYPVSPYTERGRWTDFVDKLICARLLTITILMDQVVCVVLWKAKAVI